MRTTYLLYTIRTVFSSLSINGYYPLELKNEVEVVSPEMALKALEKYFGNIISDDIYEVQRISLCQKVVQVNPDKHSAEN